MAMERPMASAAAGDLGIVTYFGLRHGITQEGSEVRHGEQDPLQRSDPWQVPRPSRPAIQDITPTAVGITDESYFERLRDRLSMVTV